MSTPNVSSSDSTQNSWTLAKKYAKRPGYLPASFTTAVRVLVLDQIENDASLRPVTKYQMARLLKVGSFKSMLYYATKDLRADKIEGRTSLSIGDMIDLYEPFDLAAMIGSFVLFRKCRKLVADDDWQALEPHVSIPSQISAQVGVAIPSIGMGLTLLMGTLHRLAWCVFMGQDAKKTRGYLRHLESSNQMIDLEYENEKWGCSSQDIGAMFLTTLGFGIQVCRSYKTATDSDISFNALTDDLDRRMKLASMWVDCVLSADGQPVQKVPGEYYPMADAREQMEKKVKEARVGTPYWLSRSREEVCPEKTPELFTEPTIDGEQEFEVPEQLKDVFSLEQITAMEEEDFDDLVDQMDLENEGKAAIGGEVMSADELEKLDGMVDE